MRLIDADKLIEELIIKTVSKDAHIISIANAVVNLVNNQLTAYDVEKVVDDLQKASMIIDSNENNIKCAIEENLAVYIVKRGGVE